MGVVSGYTVPYRPNSTAELTIAPSVSALTRGRKPRGDLICLGSNDSAVFNDAISILAADFNGIGTVRILSGDYYFAVTTAAQQVSLASFQSFVFDPGVKIHLNGDRAAFLIDGQTTAVERVKLKGKPYIDLQGDSDEYLSVIGDVDGVEVTGDLVHADPDNAAAAVVNFTGNTGYGVRNVTLDLDVYGAAYGSGNQNYGAVFASGCIKGIRGTLNAERVSYGFSPEYVDLTPTKVLMWDNSAGSFTDLTNAYDADFETGVSVDIDADDYLAYGFSLPVQSLFHVIGVQGLNSGQGLKWTQSPAVSTEYYCVTSADGDPSLPSPLMVYEDKSPMDVGTIGSLATGEYAYGDNDTLGFSTVYVRLSSGGPDPDTDPTSMFMMGAGQTSAAFTVAEVYDGSTWTVKAVTANDTPSTNNAPFERSGEVVWGEPNEDEYTSAALNGTTAYWVRLTPYDTGSGAAPTGIAAFTLNAVLGMRIPREIDLVGRIHDTGATGVQARSAHHMITRFFVTNTTNHGINHNSQNSTTLNSGWNDRYCKSRWCRDYSTVSGSEHTQVVNRACADGGIFGTYIEARESACIEQSDCGAGTVIPWTHKTVGYNYDATVVRSGRSAMRVLGDHNNIRLTVVDAAYDHSLAASSSDRAAIRIRKQNYTTAPTGNLFEGCLIKGGLGRMRHGLEADSTCDLANTWGRNSVIGASVSDIEDNGGALLQVAPKNNFATSDPTVNDDVTLGYSSGSIWINKSDAGVFTCITAADGAANWDEMAKV